MAYTKHYSAQEPSRADIDATRGPLLLEFGAPGCEFCLAAQPDIAEALSMHDMPHVKIEDGRGRKLGRSFGIKLWPTLVLIRDGVEVGRVVRPTRASEIGTLLA